MKNKNIVLLLFLLVVPLSFAYEYNLNYDSTKNTIKIGYDNLNRIVNKNSSSEIINYSYDKQLQGTLTNISFGNSTYKYTYDDKLRVIEEKRIIDGIEFTKTYVYDSNDRLVSEIFNGQDLDYYYSQQGKIQKIRGYINDTKYNPLGNPLNRTYFNNKITAFDYYQNNARLRQIKTDNIQQLNYTYDNVGSVKSINDTANNRSYSMSYDNLNRLVNVTISGFSWIYHYDATGNILKIIRNNTETTSLKYSSNPAHAPTKVITTQTGVDVYREYNYNTSNKTKVVQFYLINEKNDSVTNVNWTAEFGDNNLIESNIPFNLSLGENVLVIVEHNYSKGGNYITNVSGRASSSSDYETLNIIFGAIANSLGILKQNATLIVSEFTAKNTINEVSVNWSWNCSNNVFSTIPFNMSPNEDLLVVMEHNYSLNSGNLSCSVFSADGNQSKSTAISFDGIKIEGYNSTVTDRDTILVKFNIRNYFSTLDINWNITANGNIYRSTSPVTLNQGQASTVSQEINFTKGGLKQIKSSIGSGNFTDSYTEYYFISWININEFFTTVKNATARVFDFLIKNVNEINATATWNITNPALQSAVNLSSNESLIVVIEEDYPQGQKEVTISVFNGTTEETNLLEVFKIRQISIESLQTLHESDKTAVISSIIKNNIQPLNLSWRLNNTQEVIASTQNLELNTSEQVIIVIENNFSSSGIYPLTLMINSSSYNDNATGVAVS